MFNLPRSSASASPVPASVKATAQAGFPFSSEQAAEGHCGRGREVLPPTTTSAAGAMMDFSDRLSISSTGTSSTIGYRYVSGMGFGLGNGTAFQLFGK